MICRWPTWHVHEMFLRASLLDHLCVLTLSRTVSSRTLHRDMQMICSCVRPYLIISASLLYHELFHHELYIETCKWYVLACVRSWCHVARMSHVTHMSHVWVTHMSHVTHMSRVTHVEKSFDMRFLHCCVYRVRGRVEFEESSWKSRVRVRVVRERNHLTCVYFTAVYVHINSLCVGVCNKLSWTLHCPLNERVVDIV